MDPYTRRSTWEVIQAYRSGRTIVLCTHYMDEADILSDRVAIMSAGALQCVGSTLFLKRLFGVGYNLTLVGEPRTSAEHCSSWLQMVQKHIPNASLLSMAGVEAQFQLPHEDASGQILSLLRALDAEKEGMRVSTYSLGATTLEEVYLRAARDDLGALENCPAAGSTRGKIPMVNSGEQRPASSRPVSLRSVDSEERQALPVLPSYEKPYVGTKMLLVRQMRAIWRVRLAVRFRRPAEVIWGFFVPLGIFVLLAVIEGITNMTVDTAPRVYGVLSSFGVFFITVPLGAFCVVDRIAGIKAQQILMGVTRPTYWLGLSSSDYFVGASIVTLFIIALAIVRSPCLHQGSLYASCFCVSLFLSLFCISWVVYRLSFAFTNKALCTATNMWVGIIFGIIGGLSVAALVKSGGASADVGRTLRWILRVVSPHFCVFDALEYSTGSSFLSENPNVPSKIYKETDPWEFEASGASIFFLAIHSVVWMALCAHAEMKTVQKSSAHLARHIKWDADVPLIGGIDPDVEAERERALGPEGAQSALALHEVRKVYPKQTLPAVRDVTLAVSKGECLGLLGVNGAGKTTTMGIITASVLPSSGSALIAGEEIYDKPDLLARHLGYCPQFDAQWGHITCEEHLYFCARCRGYTEADIPSVVHDLIELVGLSKHAFKHSRTLSGGNKRKLSLAMAVLGEPTVILLDEPSAGMVSLHTCWWPMKAIAIRDPPLFRSFLTLGTHLLSLAPLTGSAGPPENVARGQLCGYPLRRRDHHTFHGGG
jgi:ABC-type multidrug transport system ATPase subunit